MLNINNIFTPTKRADAQPPLDRYEKQLPKEENQNRVMSCNSL